MQLKFAFIVKLALLTQLVCQAEEGIICLYIFFYGLEFLGQALGEENVAAIAETMLQQQVLHTQVVLVGVGTDVVVAAGDIVQHSSKDTVIAVQRRQAVNSGIRFVVEPYAVYLTIRRIGLGEHNKRADNVPVIHTR